MPPELVGLGYCVYDILAVVPGPPDFEEVGMTPLAALTQDGGGQVSTALTAAARLGLQAGYIGLLGDDAEGSWLRQRFVAERVDVTRLRLEPGAGTNVCLILVHGGTAQRAILCHRRVKPGGLVLDADDRDYIQGARVLHLDGQFMPAALQASRWARQAGVKVSYDGNHPRPGLEELLPLVNWLVVAEPFPAAYTGLSDPQDAARALLALGPELLVVTQGERGCRIWTPGWDLIAKGFCLPAVDTTGAGDAFRGGLIYALLQGWELERVAAFANAVAALNCLTLGGRRGLPSLDQVYHLLGSAAARPAREPA
jgi:sulfofructose kinase